MRASGGLPGRGQNSAGGATHRPPPRGIPGRVGRFCGASSGPARPARRRRSGALAGRL